MEMLRVQLELRISSTSERHSQHCHYVAASWCTPWHVWSWPVLMRKHGTNSPTRDSTNARLELSLTKMADGAHQEWPHQHHLLKEQTLTNGGAACPHSIFEQHHPNWETAQMLGWISPWQKWLTVLIKSGPINTIFEGANIDPPRSRMPTLRFCAASLMIHPQTKTRSYSKY